MIPTFVLQDSKTLREFFSSNLKRKGRENGEGVEIRVVESQSRNRETKIEVDPLTPTEIDDFLLPHVRSYRCSDEGNDILKRLSDILKCYEGTHHFHNFTNKMTSDDASSRRFIIEFNTLDLMYSPDGTEWVPTQVIGQSFLLHQIRKMISVAIDVARNSSTSMDEVKAAIQKPLNKNEQMVVGIAPAQGLFLDMSFFDGYNLQRKKALEIGNNPTPGEAWDLIDWAEVAEPVTSVDIVPIEQKKEIKKKDEKVEDKTKDGDDTKMMEKEEEGKKDSTGTSSTKKRKRNNPYLATFVDRKREEGSTAAAVTRWRDFKFNTIMKHIMNQEEKEHNFLNYIYVHEYCHRRYDDDVKKDQKQEEKEENESN